MGGKKKLMRLIRGEKRDTSKSGGFANTFSGHGTLSLERQAGTLLRMMAPTECSNPISAYAHVHVRQNSSEDNNSSSDDGFHTDGHHETDSDPGRDSLNSDDNIYENAYCGSCGTGLKTNFIGSDEDFSGPASLSSGSMTAGLSDDEHHALGEAHFSSDMMTESEYATLPASFMAAAAKLQSNPEGVPNPDGQKKKKSQANVVRVKKPSGSRWSTRLSTELFNRNGKNQGSGGRRKGKLPKKILVLNDFSPSSSTTDPHSPIHSDSDSLDSGRCGDTTSLHSTGSSSQTTSADELETITPASPTPPTTTTATTTSPTPSSPPKKSHRRCPSISNISFSTIHCQTTSGKSVPVIKVSPQTKLASVDESPECQLSTGWEKVDPTNEQSQRDNEPIGETVNSTNTEEATDICNNNVIAANKKEVTSNNGPDGEETKFTEIMQTRAPIYCVSHYADHLKRQLSNNGTIARSASINKSPQIKDGISPLSYLLRKLKLDLKMSYDSFVQEFVDPPHDGLGLLVALLRDIQQYQQSGTTTKRAKLDQYKKSLTDEHDCLLCIKFSLRVEGGIDKLLDLRYGLETVTSCLLSSFSKARVTALEIMTVSLSVPDGYSRVLDSMTHIRLKFGESVRFKLLVSMLNSQGSVYVLFQMVCMRFLNSLMDCTSGQNARVFLQYELEMAGLDTDQLDKNAQGDGLEYDDLRREIETWKKRYVDVQGLQDELMALQNKCSNLRHQVDSKEDRLKVLEDTQVAMETQIKQLMDSCNSYRDQNSLLQEALDKMKNQLKKKGGKGLLIQDESTNTTTVPRSESPSVLERHGSVISNVTSSTDTSNTFTIPAPPPPPPLPLSDFTNPPKSTLSVKPKVRLPLLNWQPLKIAENTVFQAMDEDQLYSELNLEEFERRFELKASGDGSPSKSPVKKENGLQKSNSEVHLLSNDRSRNLVITKRKIGLTGPEVREYVDQFDVDHLPGDYAELLLRFLPTKDEQKLLSKHAVEFSKLGEAEQFLYHLGHISDCPTKLTLMAFMGGFSDTVTSLTSQIEAIHKASVSLLSSWKLRKMFQLILALGNYMNCQRRGVAVGFRPESLTRLGDVRTADKKQTFVHYLIEIIEVKFATLIDWYEDLDITVPGSASYQSTATDVRNLKTGIGQIMTEKSKRAELHHLESFHAKAIIEMEKIQENFNQMSEFYEKACSTYGENHKVLEPGEFFGYFTKFARAFQKGYADNHKGNASSSAISSPSHSSGRTPLSSPKHDFLAEAKLLIAENGHRLATNRTLENGFTEMIKRHKRGQADIPSPIPTLTNGVQAKVQAISSDPYGLALPPAKAKPEVSSKEMVNNWILQNTHGCDQSETESEQQFRTSTMKTCSSPERPPLPKTNGHVDGDDVIIYYDDDDNTEYSQPQARAASKLTSLDHEEPIPDYTNPSSPANTISNASEISRVLREFEGNIHTLLNENVHSVKQPIPARPVDFYRPVTYL